MSRIQVISVLRRVRFLRKDWNKDLRHMTEEVGEVAKALRNLDGAKRAKMTKCTNELAEEIIDVVVCALSMYSGLPEHYDEKVFFQLLDKKIKKWEGQ